MHVLLLIFLFTFSLNAEGGLWLEGSGFAPYATLQYSQENLRCHEKKPGACLSTSKAQWEHVESMQLNVGTFWTPFGADTCEKSLCRNLITHLNVCVDGNIVLGSVSGSCHTYAREEKYTRVATEGKRGGTKSLHGGDVSLALMEWENLTPNCQGALFVGYNMQSRRYAANLHNCQHLEDEGTFHVDRMHTSVQWQGPWVGCALVYKPCRGLRLFAEMEYHRPHFHVNDHAKSYEELSDGFSFHKQKHIHNKGTMEGIKARIGSAMDIWRRWKLLLIGKVDYFDTTSIRGSVSDRQQIHAHDDTSIGEHRLKRSIKNDLRWYSWTVCGGLFCEF
jgi:hypothetical protein